MTTPFWCDYRIEPTLANMKVKHGSYVLPPPLETTSHSGLHLIQSFELLWVAVEDSA